jgi:hypothetical protein
MLTPLSGPEERGYQKVKSLLIDCRINPPLAHKSDQPWRGLLQNDPSGGIRKVKTLENF